MKKELEKWCANILPWQGVPSMYFYSYILEGIVHPKDMVITTQFLSIGYYMCHSLKRICGGREGTGVKDIGAAECGRSVL